MRKVINNIIDTLVWKLLKLRSNATFQGITLSDSAAVLERWKRVYPSTFDFSKAVAPLNPVTVDLMTAMEKEVPNNDKV